MENTKLTPSEKLINRINTLIEKFEKELKHTDEKLQENYTYWFPWGYAENKYSLEFKIAHLKHYTELINSEDSLLKDKESMLKMLEHTLITTAPHSESTGVASNRANELRWQAFKDLYDKFSFWF